MATFDLRTEPWIPVRYVDGKSGEVGLRNALVEAHHIRELDLDNPMETAALYRLLLALTIRINPETEDESAWFDRWDEGQFDLGVIDSYFELWKDRFDLFHPHYPFYQVRENIGQTPTQPSYLRHHEGGNTSSLFSGDDRKQNETLAPAEAARGVLASQYGAIGGLLSNPYKTGNKNAPGVGGTLFWIHGASLFHSLMLNAPPTVDARMGGNFADDKPAWEAGPSRSKSTRPRKGYLDYLTYQYRRLTLETSEIDGTTVVSSIRRTGGDNEEEISLEDPQIAILSADPKKKKPPGRYNISVSKAAWRDCSVFLTMTSSRGTPPRTIQWAKNNLGDLDITELEIELFAIRTRGANDGTIKIWRSERLPLYVSLLKDTERAGALNRALEAAEDQGHVLRKAAFVAAANLLSEGSDKVPSLTNALDPVPRFWPAIESHFLRLMQELATLPKAGPDWATDLLNSWHRTLHITALQAFDAATASLEQNARQLRAIAIARATVKPTERYRRDEEPISTEEESSV